MQIISLFRIILISGVITAIVGVVVGINLTDTLPILLQDYLIDVDNEDITDGEAILPLIALFSLLILLLVSTIGLWKFKRWARTLYITLTVISVLLYPTLGPVVMNAWEAMFNDLALILEGVLIAMMLTGPISEKFKVSERVSNKYDL